MITLKTDKKRLALFIALVCASSWAEADEAIEFNTDVLDASDRHNVDLQRFSEGNFVTPGEYLLDVRINSREIPQQSIRYIVDPANPHKSMACLTPQQLELLALKEEALAYIHPISATCYDISRLPGVALNNSAGVLDIIVPQAWMKYTDPDWTPPERWDNGVAGLIFDYSVSGGPHIMNRAAIVIALCLAMGRQVLTSARGDFVASIRPITLRMIIAAVSTGIRSMPIDRCRCRLQN